MTTIATDGSTMAGDGQCSYSGTILTMSERKLYRMRDGSVFGACGSHGDAVKVRDWLANIAEEPSVARDFGALWMRPDGVFWCADDLKWFKADTPVAMGSGMDFAIGAMLAGATTEQAVSIAAQRDVNTGGTIQVESLDLPSR